MDAEKEKEAAAAEKKEKKSNSDSGSKGDAEKDSSLAEKAKNEDKKPQKSSNSGSKHEEAVEKEATVTDPEKTLAEDEQDPTSGNIQQRFTKTEVLLKMVKGKRFGLGIIMVHQRILVCKVDDDSLVTGILKCGDQILQVEKHQVQDKAKCRKLLMSNLNKKGEVKLLIIRPKTQDAQCTIMEEIQLAKNQSFENLVPQAKPPTTT